MEPSSLNNVDQLYHTLTELKDLLRQMTSILVQHDKVSTTSLESMIDVVNHRFGELDKRIQKVEESIYGNGKEGLKDKVQKMEWSIRLAQWGIAIAGASIVLQVMAVVNNALFKTP